MIGEKDYKRKKTAILLLFIVFLLLAAFHRWQTYSAKEYLSAGDREYVKNNYSGALKNFNYAASLDGERNIVYLARLKKGEIFRKYGQFEKAKEELFGALEEKKDDYRAYDVLGDIYYAENKFSEAIGYYNQAVQFSHEKKAVSGINVKRAKSFMAKGELKLASDILSNLYIENDSGENDEQVYYLGLLDFNKNYSLNDYLKKLESRVDFSWKIEQIKNFIKEYDEKKSKDYIDVKAAHLYDLINEPWLAIKRMSEVTDRNNSYRDAWIVLGKSYFIAGEYADSSKSFNRALALDKHSGEIYFWLKSVYEKIGNQKKADEYIRKYENFK